VAGEGCARVCGAQCPEWGSRHRVSGTCAFPRSLAHRLLLARRARGVQWLGQPLVLCPEPWVPGTVQIHSHPRCAPSTATHTPLLQQMIGSRSVFLGIVGEARNRLKCGRMQSWNTIVWARGCGCINQGDPAITADGGPVRACQQLVEQLARLDSALRLLCDRIHAPDVPPVLRPVGLTCCSPHRQHRPTRTFPLRSRFRVSLQLPLGPLAGVTPGGGLHEHPVCCRADLAHGTLRRGSKTLIDQT